MADLEILALDPAVPQIRAPGAGDGYSVPRNMTMASGTTLSVQTVNAPTLSASSPVFTDGSKNLTTTGTINLATQASGTLAIGNGGTGATSQQTAINALAGAVTSGQYLRGNGTNVLMSAIQAGDVPTLNQNTTGTAAGLSSTLAVTSGGTGQTTYTDGQLLIGNSTGNTLTKATLTAGSGISITNGSGSISIAATGGGGTVTSVSGTGTVNGITLTGTVTTTGSLTLGGTLSNVSLTSQVTGTLPVGNGGTGIVSGTSGGIPYFSGSTTIASSAALAASALVIGGGAGVAPSTTTTGTGVVTAVGNAVNTTGGLVTQSGTLAASSLLLGGGSGTAISSTTTGTGVVTALGTNVGSAGAFVVNGGALGTPSSGTLSSCSGLPLSTGVSGTLAVANGGTGQTTYTNGQLLIGNTTGNTLTKATLTAGSGITITNGAGSITVASSASGGAQDYIVQSYGIV